MSSILRTGTPRKKLRQTATGDHQSSQAAHPDKGVCSTLPLSSCLSPKVKHEARLPLLLAPRTWSFSHCSNRERTAGLPYQSVTWPHRPRLGEASRPADRPTAKALLGLSGCTAQGGPLDGLGARPLPPPSPVLRSQWGYVQKQQPSHQSPQNKCLKLCMYLYICKLTSKISHGKFKYL